MPNDAIASQPSLDIQNLKTGDLKSFQRLYRLFYSDLVQKAAFLSNKKEAATALVNHSFIKCWLKSDTLTSLNYITAFLTTTVRNNCTAFNKRQRFDAHNNSILEAILSETTRNGLTRAELFFRIKAMPPAELRHARVLLGQFYDRGISASDIAPETGKDSATLEKVLKVAFQALHLILSFENI